MADKASKQADRDKEYEEQFAEKKTAFESSGDATESLKALLNNPPLKASNKSIKEETFEMIIKSLGKVSNYKKLLEDLGEDNSLVLIMYCYKAFELQHRMEEKITSIMNHVKLLNFLNESFQVFYSTGIARTGFERGDLWD